MTDAKTLLSGLRVVDLGAGMAAALVAKLLADVGAEVVRVPPVGDEAFEALYPAYRAWRAVGRSEPRGATPERLRELLAGADLCVIGGEDHPDVVLHELDISAAEFPRLIVIRIGGNPSDMDGEGRPSTELLAQALSGIVYEHYPDRPLAMAFAPASIGAAFQALIGGLAALIERETSGLGQEVRTSLLEGAISWLPMFWAEFEQPSPSAAFITPKDALPLVFRCVDGTFVHFVIGAAGSKYKLYQVLGIDDPSVKPGDSGMPRPGGNPRNFYGDIEVLAEHCARWKRDDLLQALWAEGLPAEPVLPPGGCWDDPQVKRNGIIAQGADGTRCVGLPFLVKRTSGSAPGSVRNGPRPLDGVRIVDFGAYVAGPLASQLLTGLGAEVIKVEPPRGEPSRGLVRGYLAANRGKKGVTLDLKDERDRASALQLALSADVVTSNFRTGVSKRLGIDPATLSALRPDQIILESPAYGSDGPSAERAGFDMVMQAVSGLEVRGGIERRVGEGLDQPLWNRLSMVDFAGGTLGAIAILCALFARARDGKGSILEMPLLNAGLYLLSELVQRSDGGLVGAEPVGADGTVLRPLEALYQTRDGWIAVVARGSDAAETLANILGLEAEPAPRTVGAALMEMGSADAIGKLRSAGLWAEECRRDAQEATLANASLVRRGLVRVTQHKDFGTVKDLGALYTMSRSPTGNKIPLHDVGEHNHEFVGNSGGVNDGEKSQ